MLNYLTRIRHSKLGGKLDVVRMGVIYYKPARSGSIVAHSLATVYTDASGNYHEGAEKTILGTKES